MEVEAKFSIPDETVFQRLLEATRLGDFHLGEVSVRELHDTYLDTERRAVQGGGYAYRLRRTDDGYQVTLKGLGGAEGAIHRRAEHELELAEPLPPQAWPRGPIRDLVLRLCGREPLEVLFTIQQTRHSRLLKRGERAVAELSLDRISICSRESVGADNLELEAELLPEGTERDLADVVAELQERWGLVLECRSKYERALTLCSGEAGANKEAASSMASGETDRGRGSVHRPERECEAQSSTASSPNRAPRQERRQASDGVGAGPAEEQPSALYGSGLLDKPGITPDDPMSEAGRKTFRFHYLRMLCHEPGTRRGRDIEALHDMRVATRRMRAAFRVFGDYFEPKVVAPYLKGLKRTGRALGAVRDLDVFRAKTQAYADTVPASERAGLEGFLCTLEARREDARDQMIEHLDSKKHHRFVKRFGKFVETEGLGSLTMAPNGGEPQPFRVRHVAPMAIYERWAAVRAYDEWVSIPNPPLPRLHALRIACKRLRYTLEFFKEVLGADTKQVIKEIVAMQDLLGSLQDAVVASRILREYLASGTWGTGLVGGRVAEQESPVLAPGVIAYLAAQQEELEHLLGVFPSAWKELNEERFRRMLAEVVSVL